MRQFKDKGHISYPQEKPQSTSTGGEGEGGQYGYITLRGGGGGACQTWIIYIYRQLTKLLCISMAHNANRQETHGWFKFGSDVGLIVMLQWSGPLENSLHQVIAIYGNEYERVNGETELHFMKERAKYCPLVSTKLSYGVHEGWNQAEGELHKAIQLRTIANFPLDFHKDSWGGWNRPLFLSCHVHLVQYSSNQQVIKTGSMSDYVTFVWWKTWQAWFMWRCCTSSTGAQEDSIGKEPCLLKWNNSWALG